MEKDINHCVNTGRLTGAIGAAFVLLMNILIIERDSFGINMDYPSDFGPTLLQKPDINFDFIIVGAGAAGCVLANKLTQRQEWTVLLIEAGGDPSPTTDVPALYPTLQNTDEDWQFLTHESNSVCQGMEENACKISKGKVLGGTSTINNLHYLRSNPRDFETWYDMGYESWGSESVNFFYERLENYKGTDFCSMSLGRGGSLPLNNFDSDHYVKKLIYNAASRFGYSKFTEFNYLGYLDSVVTVHGGIRQNMATAFLKPIKHRRNLFVVKHGYVTKLIIPDVREKRVKGVECTIDNKLIRLKAKREVLLCAGAINTVKIMMLSGLGPSKILKFLELPIVADIPVGHNMEVRLGVPVFVGLDKNNPDYYVNQVSELVDSTYLYLIHKSGPLTTTNINDVVGFINTNNQPYENPNLAIYHYYFPPNDMYFGGFLDNIGYQPEIKQSLLKFNRNQSLIMFMPTLLKPKSRGRVYLRGTNPFMSLLIKPEFLTDESKEDVQTLVAGFKYITHFVQSEVFQQHDARVLHIDIPSCRNFKFCTDSHIKCNIKYLAFPQGDVSGTAKMGLPCDRDAVVDEELLVKGVRGLRIVGAAAMPEIVSGSLQTTAAMMADKISECIKERWLPDYKPQSSCFCKATYNN